MNIIERSSLKPFLAVLLCAVIVLSSINLSSTALPKQGEESPVLSVDYYADGKILEVFKWTEIENGLEIVFKNSSKESEIIDLLIYITIDGVKGLQELDLGIDGGAVIDSLRIDLCDDAFSVLSSYATINVGANRTTVSVDGENIAFQASEIGASCVKFTVTIRNWSADTEHHFVVAAGGAEGPPPGEGEPTEEPNVYILYNEELGVLTSFNFSFTEGELFIIFSNETADSSTVEFFIIAEPRAVEFLTGFNVSIDNGAIIESISIDFYDNDFNVVEHYQAYDFGTPECSVPFDAREAIGAMKNATANFIGFKIVIGNWLADTMYTLHIIPFFSELLYYETEDTIYVDPSVADLPPEMRVWWQLYNESWAWSWTYRDITWEFGPKAQYNIYCYNTTSGTWYLVTPDTWIALNTPVKVNITIPKILFEEGTELGRIELYWNMWAVNISAYLSIYHDYSSDYWSSWSSIWNSSWSDSYSSTTGEFFTLDQTQTSVSEDTDQFKITIVGQFNDLTPKGIYHVYLNIYDNESNYIGSSSYYWDSELSLYKKVAIGGPWDEVAVYYDIMYGGTYIAEILNTDYELVRSIGINQTFIVRLNITGISDAEFRNASVIIQLPYSLRIYVNVTGWHEEYRVYHGGWVYNETSDTYVWDSNATIITKEWVFGPYLEEQWVSIAKEFNVTNYWWNGTTGEYEMYTWTNWVAPGLLLFYNNSDGTFGYYLLYEYWNHTLKEDEWGTYVESIRCWEIEEVLPELRFYEFLGGTKTVEENKIILEFEGKFVGNPGEDLWIEYRVYGDKGEIWPRDWEWIWENAKQLAIEKPVINVRIKDQSGKSSGEWYFATDPGQWFTVEVEMEGGSTIVADVDGVRVRFNCWDWYWSENETIWSNVEIIATINLKENTSEVIVYNETHKEVYEYGTYEIWNETTGMMEEVEGWHWEHYSFNQTSGEWVNMWIGWHSKDTVIDEPYLIINNYTAFISEDGKYFIEVNMSFTEYADDQRYSFAVNLLNWTYGPDYSQPWGEHLVEDWVYSIVYTINNGSVEIFVPTPEIKSYVQTSSGKKYLVVSKPYILINGEKLPLKEIKYWNGYEYEYRLLREEWDPTTWEYKRYYVLENGTKVFVYEAYNAFIYNVTIYDIDSGETYNITTYMRDPRWNKYQETWFIVALDGDIIWLSSYNDVVSVEKIAKVSVEFGGYFTVINGTTWVNLTKGWVDWDYIEQEYYILLENGTKIYVEYDYEYMYEYYFEKDGKRYYIEYPLAYYVGEYNGKSIIVPEGFKRSWYYTLVGEERVELPYEGVSDEYEWISWWDLQQPESQYGVVPEDDYALVNDSLYLVHYDYEGASTGYIVVEGNNISVTKGGDLYTKVSGKDCWNVTEIGFTIFIGNLTSQGTYNRDKLVRLNVNNYDYSSTITLLNGTTLTVTQNLRAVFYNVTVNGTTYYTVLPKPEYDWEDDVYVLYLLNGSRIELKSLEDYQFMGIVIVELGEYTGSEPETFTWNGETYNTTVQIDEYRSIKLVYEYYRVYTVSGAWYDLVPLNWLLRPEWYQIPPKYADFYCYRDELPIYNVTVNGVEYTAYPSLSHIKRVRISWGYPVTWHLEEFEWCEISYRQEVWDVIVGSPEWGLWGYRKWTINPETGALDLDGDLSTTDDQFYVKRVYEGEFGWNETRQGLDVSIVYDPNPVVPGDELSVNAWMGIAVNTYWNRWNETYYWFYTNMTPVSPETMTWINETLWDAERGAPKPGYWDIARMARNMTWEDYLEKARREGWDWVTEEVTWTWLWFGFEQSYWVSAGENETFRSYYVDLRYEYAGMFIYNDTDGDMIMGEEEATHYFIPDAVGNVTFITPGEAFGIYNETGTLVLPINESIEFGVSYLDINGTMFPFGRSYYAWYGEDVYGTDLRTFQERPVDASLEELSFKLHFYVENSTETNSTEAHVKIDQHIGDWSLDLPSGIAVLENLSLSLNYYIFAETSGEWEVVSEDGTSITPEQIVEASRISLDTAGLKFAEVNMGDTYIWGGNLSLVCNVSTHTVPLSTFVATYTGYESETSVGGWTFQSTMYFLSVGFPKWGGHFVYEDPEVVVYSGKQKKTIVSSLAEFLAGWIPTMGGAAGEEQPPEEKPPLLLMYLAVIAVVAVAIVFAIKRKRKQTAIVK